MNFKPVAMAAALGLAGPAAHAAITCTTVSSPGLSMNYVANTTMSTQTFFTVTCTRTQAADPVTVTYSVAVDNGTSANAPDNRARLGSTSSFVRYDTYQSSACTTRWAAGGAARISDTINWSGTTDFSPVSKQTTYWGCVTTAQTGMAAGAYDDSVTLSLRVGGTAVTATATAPVRIFAPAVCTITSPPGTVNFNYTAFGAAANAGTSFAVNCSNLMPYTLSLNSLTGSVLGLNYTLALSAASANGTGAAQTHTINGTMAAGQSGVCAGPSCTASQAHTVTVGY